jgi:hypothetical protein
MTGLIAAVLLLVPLSAPFGEASATAVSLDDGLRLEVSVEVEGSPTAVLVRGVASGATELPPVALSNQGGGVWGGIVEIPIIENILLGFEFIPTRGSATVSELHTLTELGVDSAVFSVDRPATTSGDDDNPLVTAEGRRWGWLGLAAGAAALTLLAFWTIGSVRDSGGEDEGESDALDNQDTEQEGADNDLVD